MPAAMNFSKLIGSPLRAGSRGSTPAKRLASTNHCRRAGNSQRRFMAWLASQRTGSFSMFLTWEWGLNSSVRGTAGSRILTKDGGAGTMAARPEFDIGGKAHLGGEIADVEEVIGFRDRERGVMEPRPRPGGEDDIVRVALALQEDEQQLLGSIRRDVFREPEAQAHP